MRFRRVQRKVLGLSLSAAGIVCSSLVSAPLQAGEPGPGEPCPSRESIGTAVESLLGERSLTSDDLKRIEVVDLGERYVVRVGERTREYTDESRDCAKRARVAAVFVALTLAPPDIGTENPPPPADRNDGAADTPPSATIQPIPQPPPAAPTPVLTPSAPANLPESTWGVMTELGTRADFAPLGQSFAYGGQVQLTYASKRWGLTLGADIPASSNLNLESVRIQQRRYSAFIGARFPWSTRNFRAGLDVCATAAFTRLRQSDVPNAETVSRVEPALHLAGIGALVTGWISPFAGVYAEFVPATVPIAVEPRGVVGHTPALWLGLVVGAALGPY